MMSVMALGGIGTIVEGGGGIRNRGGGLVPACPATG